MSVIFMESSAFPWGWKVPVTFLWEQHTNSTSTVAARNTRPCCFNKIMLLVLMAFMANFRVKF